MTHRFDQVVQAGLKHHTDLLSTSINLILNSKEKAKSIEINAALDKRHSSIGLDEVFRNSFIYLFIGYLFGIFIYLGELFIKLSNERIK